MPFVAARAIAGERLPLLAQSQSDITSTNRQIEAALLVSQNSSDLDQLNELGLQRLNSGDSRGALTIFQKLLEISRDRGDQSGEAGSLMNIGEAYRSLSQYIQALEAYQKALNIFQKTGERRWQSGILSNIGIIYERLGQYSKALESHRQALEIAKQDNNRLWQGAIFGNLGSVYQKLGQYSKAVESYQQALALIEQEENRSWEGILLNDIGTVYVDLGQHQKALEFYQRALPIAKSQGNYPLLGGVLANIGVVEKNQGNYRAALELYQQALPIFKEIGDRSKEGKVLSNIGVIYSDNLKKHSEGIAFFQQALVLFKEIGDRQSESRNLDSIGVSYERLKQYQKALEFQQQGLAIAKEIGDLDGEGGSLSNIGYNFKKLNKPELAVVFFKQSVNVRETIRQDLKKLSVEEQKSYTKTVEGTYRDLADLLLQQDRILEAQQVLDLLKVQELDDYLRNVRSNNQAVRGIDNLRPEQAILDKYGELQKSAVQIGKEFTELQKTPYAQRTAAQQQRIAQIVKLQADIDQQFNQFIDSKDVQALVDQLSRTAREQSLDLKFLSALQDDLGKAGNAVLLYPLILEDRLELILTTPDSPPIRRTVVVKREELNRTIVEFRSALKNPSSDAKVPAQKLYNWLIKPLEADLKQSGSQTIIYAPDGQLRYIPLAALFDGKQWLVERYRINNITAKSLTNLNIKPPTKPKVLAGAFGSGRYSFTVGQTPFTFNGLLGAQKEVQLLTASLPGTTTLIDSKFSRDATTTKMNEYAIVHLATHAAFVVGDPSNSFVLFGNGDRASLVDIRSWKLTNVDLIVLSACETGLGGQFGNGEEVLGLGYVFQERGARAVLASLWTVDDGGTQVLMNAFYEQLKSGNVAKVEAMRQAQIALINANNKTASNGKRSSIEIEALGSGVAPNTVNRLSHPYYWAPFILIGNGL